MSYAYVLMPRYMSMRFDIHHHGFAESSFGNSLLPYRKTGIPPLYVYLFGLPVPNTTSFAQDCRKEIRDSRLSIQALKRLPPQKSSEDM